MTTVQLAGASVLVDSKTKPGADVGHERTALLPARVTASFGFALEAELNRSWFNCSCVYWLSSLGFVLKRNRSMVVPPSR